MDKLNTRWKFIGGAVVAIVAAIVIITFYNNGQSSQQAYNTESTTTITNASATFSNLTSTPNSTSSVSTTKGSNITPPPGTTPIPAPLITITLLTPVANNIWTIGQPNPIAWDNAARVTGEIDLVDAKTKSFIGVILSETGPNQTSYSWDTREIARARYSADKKDVVPGIYSIRIKFDGNGLGNLVSGPITITN